MLSFAGELGREATVLCGCVVGPGLWLPQATIKPTIEMANKTFPGFILPPFT
jgi:hypothetical protein